MTEENTNRKRTEKDAQALKKEKLIGGEMTISEYVGLSKQQLYDIAQKGYQLIEMGNLEEAKTIYQGLIAADPFDSVFHCQLGGIFFRQKNFEKAFKEYDAAIRFNLANVDALAGRGELYLMREKYKEGIEDLRKAVENDPHAKKQSSIRARGLLLSLRDALENKEHRAETNSN
jgi:tetratricopeptide (TPR) repeat protein